MKEKFKSKMKGKSQPQNIPHTGSFGDSSGIHKNVPEDKLYQPKANDWEKPLKESKNIAAYYYYLPGKTLYLKFQNGKVYYYKEFLFDDYNTLVIADRTEDSFGAWINREVVKKFTGIALL